MDEIIACAGSGRADRRARQFRMTMSRQTDPASPVLPAKPSAVFTVRGGEARASLLRTESGLALSLPLPLLAGPAVHLLASGQMEEQEGILAVRGAGQLTGALIVPAAEDLRGRVRDAYARLLRMTTGLNLRRIWNYVPQINQSREGLENYRAFNAGRHDAVTACFGQDFRASLPAASAVGAEGSDVIIAFSAGEDDCRHFENPRQCPSCDYPVVYGDPPPVFARGTAVEREGHITHHLSGTASIRGHASAGDTLQEQFSIMSENIRLMLGCMGTPENARADWRVFLRHAGDLAEAQALFAAAFPGYDGTVQWLRADICRANLLTEIEGVFSFTHP